MSEAEEIILSENPDFEFPLSIQGNWIGNELDSNGNLELLEISKRSIIWCGIISDFAAVTLHRNSDCDIEAIEVTPSSEHPDPEDWGRYNIQYIMPQEDGESIVIANSKLDSTLERVHK
ncbi:MAG: hypothetical protein ACRCY3_03465 [Sphingorhabdus sp.]